LPNKGKIFGNGRISSQLINEGIDSPVQLVISSMFARLTLVLMEFQKSPAYSLLRARLYTWVDSAAFCKLSLSGCVCVPAAGGDGGFEVWEYY
jgi:hypothetical protein